MWLKLLLALLFTLSLLGALVIKPAGRSDSAQQDNGNRVTQDGKRLRLLTWNIGNGDLESETRAHTEDLPAVAQVILDNDADAVALQELAGDDQLKLLLTQLTIHIEATSVVVAAAIGSRLCSLRISLRPAIRKLGESATLTMFASTTFQPAIDLQPQPAFVYCLTCLTSSSSVRMQTRSALRVVDCMRLTSLTGRAVNQRVALLSSPAISILRSARETRTTSSRTMPKTIARPTRTC